MSFDLAVFQAFHAYVGASGWLNGFGIFCARYLPFLVVACAVLFLVRERAWRGRVRRGALIVLAVIASWGVLVPLIRLFVNRLRPPAVLDIQALIPLPESGSMPSGHATFFFALATAIFLIDRRWGIGFFISAALIALARVFVGVHWPTDVLVGALLGIGGAYVARHLLNRT